MNTGKRWLPQGLLDTPYKRAQAEWDSRIGTTEVQAFNWRMATFATLLFVAFPSICGMIYLGSQPKVVPHIIEIAQDGGATYRGPIGKHWDQFKPSDPSIKYHITRFIHDTRTISSDPAVLKENWLDAYKLLGQKAATKLSAYVQKADPFKRAAQERISIDVLSMVRVSENSWQVDWKEHQWGQGGEPLGDTTWRGIFTIILQQPKTENEMIANPIGLFIDDYNISQIYK